jgi:hypothetical protein
MPDVILRKTPPKGLYRNCEETHWEICCDRSGRGKARFMHATIAFRIVMRSITFEDNPGGKPAGRKRRFSRGDLTGFPRRISRWRNYIQ